MARRAHGQANETEMDELNGLTTENPHEMRDEHQAILLTNLRYSPLSAGCRVAICASRARQANPGQSQTVR
jgi:hypothetical protein